MKSQYYLGGKCFSDAVDAAYLAGSVVSIPKSELYLLEDEDAFVFSLTVSKMARVASTSVSIQVTEDDVPDVIITSSASGSSLHESEPLQLVGSVSGTLPLSSYTFEWVCQSNNFDLTDGEKVLTSATSKDLVIKEFSLIPGAVYKFQLLVGVLNSTVAPGVASVVVVVNEPPAGGFCFADPPTGTAMNTVRLGCARTRTNTSKPSFCTFGILRFRASHHLRGITRRHSSLRARIGKMP